MLFNVMNKVLALAINQKHEIGGILMSSLERKILLYVDDSVFVLCNPEELLKAFKKLLCSFGTVSGYTINNGKSIMLGLNIRIETSRNIQRLDCTPWRVL